MSGYNGWRNYETWLLKLWLDNDQGSSHEMQEWAQECVQLALDEGESTLDEVTAAAETTLAERIEAMVDEDQPEVTGFYADVLRAAIGEVDYREIAGSYLGDMADEIKEQLPQDE